MLLNEALQLYNIPYQITETITGAGFTSYKLTPAGSSATIQRLKTRMPDLESVTGCNLEIIKDPTGVYIRVKDGQTVYNYMDYNGYIDYKSPRIPFIVGFDNVGSIVMDDLESARHMLIAGTTGSGKSVFLHDLLVSFCCNPHIVLYLVDCKQCEFNMYENRNIANVAYNVFDSGKSAGVFTVNLIKIMESRYKRMKQCGVNDFLEYKRLFPDEKRHVLVIDELSDLISDRESRRVIVPRLLRIAQKGRAAGVHLILATQRPDASVINGTLKGNLPTRAAFRTISNIDSRIILDQSGAERLTGNGDLLYLRNGSMNLERLQAPYISLDEVRKVTA